MDATFGQFFHIFRIKHQVQGIHRRIVAQNFLHLVDVHAQSGRAPHVVDRIGIAGIVFFRPVLHYVPQVPKVRQLRGIEFLENTGRDLALQERSRRYHHIITAAASQEFRLENFVRVENIVNQVNAGFGLELFQQGLIDIIRPVIHSNFLGERAAGKHGHERGRKDSSFCHVFISHNDNEYFYS